MKVLQVLPALDSGGVERGTIELANALVAAGHESHVASAGGRLVSRLTRHGSQHHHWRLDKKSPLTLLKVAPFRRWLREQRFDIVHNRSRMPGWVSWLAWRGLDESERPGLVSTVHGLHSVSRYSEIVTYGERVIVVSDAVRRYVETSYPRCDLDRLRLIYRGINPLEFPHNHQPSTQWLTGWYREYPQLLNRRVVTIAGRLTRLKGHHDFIRVIEGLREKGLDAHGLIVGGEDPHRLAYARELYKSVDAKDLGADITFAGHREDLHNIYAVSDAVVSLSTQAESFGRTVLEPLSEGRPTAGYAHGGVAEILDSLYPNGAIPPGDTKAMTDRLESILTGQFAPPRKNTEFLLDRMTSDTINVYQELLREKGLE
ncbi:MAG: glycosyltransferase [Pseudomonadota bacterium]